MRESQFAAGSVNVIAVTQIFHGHGRTLKMPGRSHISPVGLDVDAPLELGQLGSLQKREVPRVIFFILIQIHRGTEPNLVNIDPRQTAVFLESRDVKID